MGTILIGSGGSTPVDITEVNAIPIPIVIPSDPIILLDTVTEEIFTRKEDEFLGTILLSEQTLDPGNTPIAVPASLPATELIGQESVIPAKETIILPSTVPSPELMPVEDIISPSDTITIPDKNIIDPIVLIEENIIPVFEENPLKGSIFGVDKYYVHTQSVPADTWEVWHNLQKHPSIRIEDLNGKEIIAEIIHISNTHAHILFDGNYIGTAHCN